MQNNGFTHYIITRYNIPIKGWEKSKDRNYIDNSWMEHRFSIFRNYCFASVRNQDNQNFTWLIFLDINTSEKHKEQLQQLMQYHSNYKLIYVKHYRHFLKKLKEVIEFQTKTAYIISSRLDNDDSIRKDFVNSIQENFNYEKKCILDFPHGYTLEIEPLKRFAYRQLHLNPFISLIEERESAETVMRYFRHRGWKRSDARIKTIKGKRVWMQIIHHKNLLNTFKGMHLCNKTEVIEDFGIEIRHDIKHPNIPARIKHFFNVLFIRAANRMRYIKKMIVS